VANTFCKKSILLAIFSTILISGCATNELPTARTIPSLTTDANNYRYLVGPGDELDIFVWRNPEISGTYSVRPDGKLTTSLVEDIDVTGKTPADLARELEESLSLYINNPKVTVSVSDFQGPFSEQVRVIGEVREPNAVNFVENMTLLDLIIAVGGLTEFASGNNAKLVRVENGNQVTYDVFIDDLITNGDINKNVDLLPGDIVIVPESWF